MIGIEPIFFSFYKVCSALFTFKTCLLIIAIVFKTLDKVAIT